jgi:AAA15 family ATPase/GTPase
MSEETKYLSLEETFRLQQLPIIKSISVAGFKSIREKQSIEIRSLTILAGANSSGKSSIMQPLLLLKQTLESPYIPASALKIDGPNVKFSASEQFISSFNGKQADTFEIGIGLDTNILITTSFQKQSDKPLEIQETHYQIDNLDQTFHRGMTQAEIAQVVTNNPNFGVKLSIEERQGFLLPISRSFKYSTTTNIIQGTDNNPIITDILIARTSDYHKILKRRLQELIHVSSMRGSTERNYPAIAFAPLELPITGKFEPYTGSAILSWQQNQAEKFEQLNQDLASLELGTNAVRARQLTETEIEILVSRTATNGKPSNGKQDYVSLADVGLGVSHVLPVLVALLAADRGSITYIEEPEMHLHPRAQIALAQILANAALRGVQVVVETHSDLLLLSIQTLVAQGKLSPDLVKLHWFSRDKKSGATKVDSHDLDAEGSFGKWPQDFSDTNLKAQQSYLNAVAQLYQPQHNA